jgi:hypothetical protein
MIDEIKVKTNKIQSSSEIDKSLGSLLLSKSSFNRDNILLDEDQELNPNEN